MRPDAAGRELLVCGSVTRVSVAPLCHQPVVVAANEKL